jgi:hypothetical protein
MKQCCCLEEMKKHYARDTKDIVMQKEDGDAILFAFEKYTLGRFVTPANVILIKALLQSMQRNE